MYIVVLVAKCYIFLTNHFLLVATRISQNMLKHFYVDI